MIEGVHPAIHPDESVEAEALIKADPTSSPRWRRGGSPTWTP